jgi:hypothetical protein
MNTGITESTIIRNFDICKKCNFLLCGKDNLYKCQMDGGYGLYCHRLAYIRRELDATCPFILEHSVCIGEE